MDKNMVMQGQIFLGHYRLIKPISSGGFGTTYLVEDTQIHPPADCRRIIKKLKPIQDNPRTYSLIQERFRQEVKVLQALGNSHAQIPVLYGYLEEGNNFYLIQEYIDGQTLDQWVREKGTFSSEQVKKILLQLLEVLTYLQSKRIIHRDIKPENVILQTPDNLPVLIDFGAIKETLHTEVISSGHTHRSLVIGTPGFMPPEQSIGRPVFASDIYALGLTGIYLLTGKRPEELESDLLTGELRWQMQETPVDPTLAAVLNRAIRPNAKERYAKAEEMIKALKMQSVTSVVPTQVVSQPNYYSTISQENRQENSRVSKSIFPSLFLGMVIGMATLGGILFYLKPWEKLLIAPVDIPVSPSPEIPDSPPPVFTEQDQQLEAQKRQLEEKRRQLEEIQRLKEYNAELEKRLAETSPETPPSPTPEAPVLENYPLETSPTYLDEKEAIEVIEDLYHYLSQKQYSEAVQLYSPQLANQFNGQFFDQFERVTVENLRIESRNENSIEFVGQNTYIYPSGATQKELRSYTVSYVENQPKITASEFIKVTKFW